MAKNQKKPMITWAQKFLFCCGVLGSAAVQAVAVALFMPFAVLAHGMPPWLAGLLLLAALTVSAIIERYALYAFKRVTSAILGKNYFSIIMGFILAACFCVALFVMQPDFPVWAKSLWLVFTVMPVNIACRIFNNAMSVLGMELCGSPEECKTMRRMLVVFLVLGAAAAAVLSTAFLLDQLDNCDAYMNIAFISAGALLIGGLVAVFASYPESPRLSAKVVIIGEPPIRAKEELKNFWNALKSRKIGQFLKTYANLVLKFCLGMLAVIAGIILTLV